MAGRPSKYNKEELIDRAIGVFWVKGYNASSAKDLMDAMDIGQGSFYLNFKGGKKELYHKSLVRFWEISKKSFEEGLNKHENPLNFLKHFFYSRLNRSYQEALNGCYFGNAIVEFRNLDIETRELTSELMLALENEFKKALILAQEKDFFSKDKKPEIIARYLLNLLNGFNITQRVNPDKDFLEKMLEENLKVLE